MNLLKWLTTLKLYVVRVQDQDRDPLGPLYLLGREKFISIHFTRAGANCKIKEESKKRWAKIANDADNWLVTWTITERTVVL